MPKSPSLTRYPPIYGDLVRKAVEQTGEPLKLPFRTKGDAIAFRFDLYAYFKAAKRAQDPIVAFTDQLTLNLEEDHATKEWCVVMTNRLTHRFAAHLESLGFQLTPPPLNIPAHTQPQDAMLTAPMSGVQESIEDPMSLALKALGFGDGSALKTTTREIEERENEDGSNEME